MGLVVVIVLVVLVVLLVLLVLLAPIPLLAPCLLSVQASAMRWVFSWFVRSLDILNL